MNLKRSYEGEPIRLQVFLAHSGIASRRASEELISQGRISVNGRVITVPGEKVSHNDDIRFDGLPVKKETRFLYYLLHKPPMYLCSSSDPEGRRLALSLLPKVPERLYSVGRLDYLSSGLIIFTNDGAFTEKVGHPRAEIEKEYIVESTVPVPDSAIEEFLQGVEIDKIIYKAKKIERINRKTIRVTLVEGRNREIRRVFSHFHLHPKSLKRVRIGQVKLGDLKEGESRPLTSKEIKSLKEGKTW